MRSWPATGMLPMRWGCAWAPCSRAPPDRPASAGTRSPIRFRPGTILQSNAGQIFIVSGEYKHLVPSMELFHQRGYSNANIYAATDEELALHKTWPTPLN